MQLPLSSPKTFTPGEIRTCEGCHGINGKSHLGNNAPQNKPEVLRSLLRRWKAGEVDGLQGIDEGSRTGANGLYLYQNTPNPFYGSTSIQYAIPEKGHVSITIFNMMGQKVKTLVNHSQAKGSHVIAWDGTSDSGATLSGGIFVCRIKIGDQTVSNKVVLARN